MTPWAVQLVGAFFQLLPVLSALVALYAVHKAREARRDLAETRMQLWAVLGALHEWDANPAGIVRRPGMLADAFDALLPEVFDARYYAGRVRKPIDRECAS